jgi:hypothetical protein
MKKAIEDGGGNGAIAVEDRRLLDVSHNLAKRPAVPSIVFKRKTPGSG